MSVARRRRQRRRRGTLNTHLFQFQIIITKNEIHEFMCVLKDALTQSMCMGSNQQPAYMHTPIDTGTWRIYTNV